MLVSVVMMAVVVMVVIMTMLGGWRRGCRLHTEGLLLKKAGAVGTLTVEGVLASLQGKAFIRGQVELLFQFANALEQDVLEGARLVIGRFTATALTDGTPSSATWDIDGEYEVSLTAFVGTNFLNIYMTSLGPAVTASFTGDINNFSLGQTVGPANLFCAYLYQRNDCCIHEHRWITNLFQ